MIELNMTELNDRELLVKVATQLEGMTQVVNETRQSVKELSDETRRSVKELDTKIDAVGQQLKKDFITKEEFEPIRRIVYGLVALMLTGVIMALLASVIIQP